MCYALLSWKSFEAEKIEYIRRALATIDDKSEHSKTYVKPSDYHYQQGCSDLLPRTIGNSLKSKPKTRLIVIEKEFKRRMDSQSHAECFDGSNLRQFTLGVAFYNFFFMYIIYYAGVCARVFSVHKIS